MCVGGCREWKELISLLIMASSAITEIVGRDQFNLLRKTAAMKGKSKDRCGAIDK